MLKEKDSRITELEMKVFDQNEEIYELKQKEQQLELNQTQEYEDFLSKKETHRENQKVLGSIIKDFFKDYESHNLCTPMSQ